MKLNPPRLAFWLLLPGIALVSGCARAPAAARVAAATAPIAPDAQQARIRKALDLAVELQAPQTRLAAARALREMGPDAAPAATALVQALDDADPDSRHALVEALLAIGPHALRDIVIGVGSEDADVRSLCAAILADMGEAADPFTRSLIAALGNRSPELRIAALLALEGRDRRVVSVMVAIRNAASDPHPDVRELAGALACSQPRNFEPALIDRVPWGIPIIGGLHRFVFDLLYGAPLSGFRVPRAQTLRLIRSPSLVERVNSISRETHPSFAGQRLDDLIAHLTEEQASLLAPWLADARRAIDDALMAGHQWPPAQIPPVAVATAQELHARRIRRILDRARDNRVVMGRVEARARLAAELIGKSLRRIGDAPRRVAQGAAPLLAQWRGLLATLPDTARQTVLDNMDRLERGNNSQKTVAIERLRRIAPIAGPAVALLNRTLKDPNRHIRRLAADALGTAEARRILEIANSVESLRRSDPDSRAANARALHDSGLDDPETLETIVLIMDRPDWLSRDALAEAAVLAWRHGGSIREHLKRMTERQKPILNRLSAIAAIKMLDAANADDATIADETAAALALLHQRIAGDDPAVAIESLGLLRGLTSDLGPSQDVIARAAHSPDRELRHKATEALASMGQAGVESLVALLHQDDVDLQGLALVQLGRLGPDAKSAQPELILLLQHVDWRIARMASNALGAIGAGAERAIDALAAIVQDRKAPSPLRIAAMRALRKIDAGDPRSIAAAAAARADGNPALGEEAELAAGLPPRALREELADAVRDLRNQNRFERFRAARRIARSEALAPPIAAALIKAVDSGDFILREGLTLGIEQSWRQGKSIQAVLKSAAADDAEATNRAYAKAALRALMRDQPSVRPGKDQQ